VIPSQVYGLARAAGFDPAAASLMTAISGAESGFNPDALGDIGLENATWGPSVGLWQIRSLKAQAGTGQPRDATRLTQPDFNARAAYSIYRGQGLSAWSTYTSGAYRRYLGAAQGGSSGPQDAPSGKGGPSGPQDAPSGAQNAGLFDNLNPVSAAWDAIKPALVTGGFVTAGVVLVVIGVTVTALPAVRQAAPMIGAAAL